MALPATQSFAASFYLPLRERALLELEAEFYARTSAAEAGRAGETSSATTIEAGW